MLGDKERELVFRLAEDLTGTCQSGKFRRDILVRNVEARIKEVGAPSLERYLLFAESSPEEFGALISALTIHATSWFRESAHFKRFEALLAEFRARNPGGKFRLWSAACSSGEEAYSFALLLEEFRLANPGFDYEVHGSDIDPVSVNEARRSIYPVRALIEIPETRRGNIYLGSGATEGMFTLSPEIRTRCRFFVHSLLQPHPDPGSRFDLVLCRNVLIYFAPERVKTVVRQLAGTLASGGTLCLGHSELIDAEPLGLRPLGNSMFQPSVHVSSGAGPIQKMILVIDSSVQERQSIRKFLDGTPYEMVTAGSISEASEFLKVRSVDLIALDLKFAGGDANAWLRRSRSEGLRTPVIILGSGDTDDAQQVVLALESGAQAFLDKTSLGDRREAALKELAALVEHPLSIPVPRSSSAKAAVDRIPRPEVILIGASTGGPEALIQMLSSLPKDCPPVLVVQHITRSFLAPFARRLAQASGLRLGEARSGVPLEPGTIYLALEEKHIGVRRHDRVLELNCWEGAPIYGHRPSVDFLFQSAAASGARCLAALLTGMGRDGARGLLELRKTGSFTIAQDEQSSVVFGMPAEAIRMGAALQVGNLEEIRALIDQAISGARASRVPGPLSA